MRRRFEGRSVLVSGASRGLGRAIAVAFGAEGAWVGIGYRDRREEAQETLRAVEEAGGSGAPLQLDVTRKDGPGEAVAAVLAERQAIDVLVNNAGVLRDELFALAGDDALAETLETNLAGAIRLCRAVVRPMLASRRGAIVNVASVAGVRANPGQSSYAASKGGLLAFTRTIALELAPGGVRVNAVVPGLIGTGMTLRMDARSRERRSQAIPAGRVGTGPEVAAAVLFLASDEASYVTGQALAVDGGLSL